MVKILICAEKIETATYLYKQLLEMLTEIKARCELSYSISAQTLTKITEERGSQYDIYILDSCDKECIALSAAVRRKNLIPSIVFFGDRGVAPGDLIKQRPSFLIDLKKSSRQALIYAIKWCLNEQLRSRTCFNVKNKDVQMRIPYDSILYFESHERIVSLYTANKTFEFYAKLANVLSELPLDKFLRCHQSYIVNIEKISRLDKVNRKFIMQSGAAVDISKSQYKSVVDTYERLTGVD